MKVILVGAGRYGKGYVKQLIEGGYKDVVFAGVVEKNIDGSPAKDMIFDAGIPVYKSLEEFYEKDSADLVILCTPPFLHAEQSRYCVNHGSYVLCEKPLCPSTEEAEIMLRAEKESGKFIAIGFQWSFTKAIRALKDDVLSGKLGKPLLLKTMISWPRNNVYYSQDGWNGKRTFNGNLTNDSILFNACAHFLHNMLFVLGEKTDECIYPDKYDVVCYRAYDIETYDTCFLHLFNGETELRFVASHVANPGKNPVFEYVFENATVRYDWDNGQRVVAEFSDGTQKDYGILFDDMTKLDDCIEAVRNGSVPVCTVKTAIPHARLTEEIANKVTVRQFPKDKIVITDNGRYVPGLFEQMKDFIENGKI